MAGQLHTNPYDIIVRFPSKEIADEFCGQMSDGFGEGFCDFCFWRQKAGTTGNKNSDFEKITEGHRDVFFVEKIFDI